MANRNNFLDYTKLTYSEIMDQINAKLAADPRFENFRESSIAQTIVELFAGVVDLNNYYLERRSEENYLDTAKLRSSAILLAKQLGYIVTRPVPATSSIKINFIGGLPSYIVAGDVMQIRAFTPFIFDGNTYLLNNTYTYTFTQSDVTNGVDNPNWTKEIQYGLVNTESNNQLISDSTNISVDNLLPIGLIQGEFKYKEILGSTNSQAGNTFQIYKISDTTFSNKYGTEDYFGTDSPDSELNVTKVKVGNSFSAGTAFTIDRRSLITPGDLVGFGDGNSTRCLIRTSYDEGVELVFGDGNYTRIGAQTTADNIFIQYLSTTGARANRIGIVGEKINIQQAVLVNNDVNKNITQYVEFTLNSNIIGGGDMESLDSIKINAPALYYSLDRLITSSDYKSYLKSLTSPITVKNAIAWGEQEEGGSETPIPKLINVALFSLLGAMYNVDGEIAKIKTIDASDVDDNLSSAMLDDIDSLYSNPPNSWFNILCKDVAPDELGTVGLSGDVNTNNILNVYDKLENRSPMTIRNVYVTPIIHEYTLDGTVYVNKFSNASTARNEVINTLYNYLNENADFNQDIFISNIIEEIEKLNSTHHVNLTINPETPAGIDTIGISANGDMNLDADADFSAWVLSISAQNVTNRDAAIQAVKDIYKDSIHYWRDNVIAPVSGLTWASLLSGTAAYSLTEKNFYTYMMTYAYDNMVDIRNTDYSNWSTFVSRPPYGNIAGSTQTMVTRYLNSYFNNVMIKIHNTLVNIIKNNIMGRTSSDTYASNNNITEYSLGNEIAKIKFNASVVYAS